MSEEIDISTLSIKAEKQEKLRNIVENLRRRTQSVKKVIEQPPTPTDESEEEVEEEPVSDLQRRARELVLEDFTESRYASRLSLTDPDQDLGKWRCSGYIDPRGNLNIGTFYKGWHFVYFNVNICL